MAKKKFKGVTSKRVSMSGSEKEPKVQMGLAIIALVLNVFVPGLGTMVAGKSKEGAWQLILFFIGLALISIGYNYSLATLYFGALISLFSLLWAIVLSVQMVISSKV